MARPAMWKVRVESEAKVELKTTGDLEAMAGAETGCRGTGSSGAASMAIRNSLV